MNNYIASESEEKELVLRFFQGRRDGIFVEAGANGPVNSSQTWLMEQNGWRGVLVEPLAALCKKLREKRENSQIFQVACSSPEQEGEAWLHIGAATGHSTLETAKASAATHFAGKERVKITTLNKVLQSAGVTRIDFPSLDVEGHEIELMSGLDFQKFRPTLILIEDGLLDLRRHRFLTVRGYRIVKRTRLNHWYVPVNGICTWAHSRDGLSYFAKYICHSPSGKSGCISAAVVSAQDTRETGPCCNNL